MSEELQKERDKSYKRAQILVERLAILTGESLAERRELLRDIGFAYIHAARPEKAAEYWKEALALIQANRADFEIKDLALAHRDVAQAFDFSGHFADAEVHYRLGLDHCSGLEEDFTSENNSPAGIIRIELADNLARQGKYQEAGELFLFLLNEQKEALNSMGVLKQLPGLPVLGDLLSPLLDQNIARYAVEYARMRFRLGLVEECLAFLEHEDAARTFSGSSRSLILDAMNSIRKGLEPKVEDGQTLIPFYQQ